MDTKAEAATGKAGESAAAAAAPPQKHLSIPLLRGSEGGRAGGPRDGEFQSGDGSGRGVEWSGEKKGERMCVRVDGGRIELWEKDGWMEGGREGGRQRGESGLLG